MKALLIFFDEISDSLSFGFLDLEDGEGRQKSKVKNIGRYSVYNLQVIFNESSFAEI